MSGGDVRDSASGLGRRSGSRHSKSQSQIAGLQQFDKPQHNRTHSAMMGASMGPPPTNDMRPSSSTPNFQRRHADATDWGWRYGGEEHSSKKEHPAAVAERNLGLRGIVSELFPRTEYFKDPRFHHTYQDETGGYVSPNDAVEPIKDGKMSTRRRTVGAALVMCMNIGDTPHTAPPFTQTISLLAQPPPAC